MSLTRTAAATLGATAVCLAAVLVPPAVAEVEGTVTQVTVSPAGESEAEGQGRYDPTVSRDGRFVAYYTYASSVVAGDTNDAGDVFVWDRDTGRTTLVSRAPDGSPGNDTSLSPQISANGKFIVFMTFATNLGPEGTINPDTLVYRYNVSTGDLTLVSKSPRGAALTKWAGVGSISATGRYVAYYTQSHNAVPGDHNSRPDVFRYDAVLDETIKVSQTLDGGETDKYSHGGRLSADGRYVAYSTKAENMGPSDTNRRLDTYIYDTRTGITTLASHDADGMAAGGEATGISKDGSIVSMTSTSTTLSPRDTDPYRSAYVYRARSDSVALVSPPSQGADGIIAFSSGVSSDGRYLTYDAVRAGDQTGTLDVFLYDRVTKETTTISQTPSGGVPNGSSSGSRISAGGDRIAFVSAATNLVPGDPHGNADVFVWSAN